ncbi:c-di-GMP phosphodiesterase [Xylanibacillus composti]|uniref:Phosphodiesterase n=1 Tax=Xylanibacillus composti TaxID=1572762 RepID=A0A8J4H7C6_9BACL|nr:HD domain-containing phosphohydrolase [Xylanibacillus composti]MDT9726444.1 c-di-GMP phosphodiesterase [Xylanibacillus composti]GIQ71112.1 phosphodiesterase [Xylanibacillus composti]
MRIIPIDQYDEKSMILAMPVYDSQRRILIAANQTIHPKFQIRLKHMGIRVLVIEDAISKGITLEEMIDMPTWLDIAENIRDAHAAVRARKPIQMRDILSAAGKLIRETQLRPVLVPIPTSTISMDLAPYAHAVNVALLALQVGNKRGYNDLMLRDLAVGCLLHSIGEAVTADADKVPEAGFQVLRNVRELSLVSSHIAFQYNERLDGSGAPRGIKGSAFHEYAQIGSMCKLYDRAVSSEELLPHEAMEAIMAMSGLAYTHGVINDFVRAVPAYPPGTMVKLQSGKEALVVKITNHMQRPVVRELGSKTEIDLSDHPTVMIQGVKPAEASNF